MLGTDGHGVLVEVFPLQKLLVGSGASRLNFRLPPFPPQLLAVELGMASTRLTAADKAEHLKRQRHSLSVSYALPGESQQRLPSSDIFLSAVFSLPGDLQLIRVGWGWEGNESELPVL